MKRLEAVTNIAILIAVIVFLGLVAEARFRPKPHTSASSAIVGQTLHVSGMSQGSPTLVLAISTTCHFCKASEGFYKQLLSTTNNHLKTVAIFPQSESEAKAYLKGAQLAPTQVISADLSSVDVSATPTLLLLDTKGKITKAWVGQLDAAGQQQVLKAVSRSLS